MRFEQPKQWGRWVALAIVLIFVFKNPAAAAHMANHAAGLIGQGADALSKFTSALNL